MGKRLLLDKCILGILGLFVLMKSAFASDQVLYLLVALSLSGLLILSRLFETHPYVAIFVMMVSFALLPQLLCFAPFFYYDVIMEVKEKRWWLIFAVSYVLAEIVLWPDMQGVDFFLIGNVLAGYLGFSTWEAIKKEELVRELEDDAYEMQKALKKQNDEWLSQQEKVISFGVAEERTRIARDIHDNVGHLLSSALLQIAALQTINQEEKLKQPLVTLRGTVDEGMTQMRESVHNLRDISADLETSVKSIVASFDYCPVNLAGEFPKTLPDTYKPVILAVVKEGLTNVMKHTNAQNAEISFQTFPGFYKLQVRDDGTKTSEKAPNDKGMGLGSLEERIGRLKGRLTFRREHNGAVLLVILPREDKGEES